MSGSIGRRHSKWDFKDSEALAENFNDQELRRPKESFSPNRDSRRNYSSSKERMMTWDREGNYPRISPGLDDYKHQHRSRSPGNGWRHSYSNRSRSRSRSQSPIRSLRRESMVDDRSRSRTGVSAEVCRDFAKGRCRRGDDCQFLHQDAHVYNSRRRTAECSPPDDWESKSGRTGGSRHSPADTRDYASRSEKSMHVCSEFLRGKCRRGASCRYLHHDTVADVFEKGSVDDVYNDRDSADRSRDLCPRRNHSHEFEKAPLGDVYRDRDRLVDDVHRARESDRHIDDVYRVRDRDRDRPVDDAYRRDRDRPVDDVYRRDRDRDRPVDDAYRKDRDRPVDDVYRRDRDKPVDDVYRRDRDRDRDHRSGDGYRTRDHEPHKRGETLCKFFASGNCRNGNHCRFLHQVQERNSPDRSEDVRQGPDFKPEKSLAWNGPKWKDVIPVSTVPPVQGWGEGDTVPLVQGRAEGDNVVTEMSKKANTALSGDDSCHGLHKEEQTWGGPTGLDNSQIRYEKQAVQWKTEKSNPVVGFPESGDAENFGGDMDMSPRNFKQHGLSSSDFQAPSLSNSSFPAFRHNAADGPSYERPYSAGFEQQRLYSDHLSNQNPSYEEKKPTLSSEEGRSVFGINDTSSIIPSPTMNLPPGPGIFQIDQSVKFQPISGINSHMGGQPQVSSNPCEGSRMEPSHVPSNVFEGSKMEPLHDSSFLNSKVVEETHVINATTSALASATAAGLSTVTSEQLVQLSHISASLAQLLENRQQLPQLSSASDPRSVYTADSVAPISQASGSTIEPMQAAETLKHYDSVGDGIEPKVQNLGSQMLPGDVEQINANNELDNNGNMKHQEPAPKDDEISKKTAEGTSKATGKGPSEDVAADDAADDGKKSKDSKEVRAFKFALAEFVKELLKPSWKDGQVSKDAYKTIVKKVVDKVTGTQGVQIPQTKDKIDQYLSCSKPKIEKLVQAYVGKFKKS